MRIRDIARKPMTWLLAQGEHLPVILIAIVLTIMICRIMFASRGDIQVQQSRLDDVRESDSKRMESVTRMYQNFDTLSKDITVRIDEWTRAVHTDVVRLYELAHDHSHRKDGDPKEKAP